MMRSSVELPKGSPLKKWKENEIDQLVELMERIMPKALQWHNQLASEENEFAKKNGGVLEVQNPPPVEAILTHLKNGILWGELDLGSRGYFREVLSRDPVGRAILMECYIHHSKTTQSQQMLKLTISAAERIAGLVELALRNDDNDSASRFISILEGRSHSVDEVQRAGIGIRQGDRALMSYAMEKDADTGEKVKRGGCEGRKMAKASAIEKELLWNEKGIELIASNPSLGRSTTSLSKAIARNLYGNQPDRPLTIKEKKDGAPREWETIRKSEKINALRRI